MFKKQADFVDQGKGFEKGGREDGKEMNKMQYEYVLIPHKNVVVMYQKYIPIKGDFKKEQKCDAR